MKKVLRRIADGAAATATYGCVGALALATAAIVGLVGAGTYSDLTSHVESRAVESGMYHGSVDRRVKKMFPDSWGVDGRARYDQDFTRIQAFVEHADTLTGETPFDVIRVWTGDPDGPLHCKWHENNMFNNGPEICSPQETEEAKRDIAGMVRAYNVGPAHE